MTNKAFYEGENWKRIRDSLSPSFRQYRLDENSFIVERVKSSDMVLDVGSGNGDEIDAIIKDHPAVQITGIDVSQATVTALRQKYSGKPGVTISLADICALPQGFGKFSRVLLPFNLLGNLAMREQSLALENVLAALEADGLVLGSVYAESAREYQIECYRDYLGFQIEMHDESFVCARTPKGNLFKSQRFTKAGLASLLRESGLELTELARPGKGFYYVYGARGTKVA